jgi:alpha-tubulin suppressor-like RCC1 family protein
LDVVSVFVATDGVAKFDYLGRVLPDGTLLLPSTLALVQPENPNAQVHIRVTAFQTQGTQENARVLRDVLTTVPTAGTALLRLPLDFLDDGSGQGTLPAQYVPEGVDSAPDGLTLFDPTTTITSSCDPMQLCKTGSANCQTMVNGMCTGATVNSSTLPPYTQSEVFGDGGLSASGAPESCFDVESCFQGATPVPGVGGGTCSFTLASAGHPMDAGTSSPSRDASTQSTESPADAAAGSSRPQDDTVNLAGSNLNLALVTQSTGACLTSGQCYVPLPSDPNEGWTLQGNTVQLSQGVCMKLGSGVTLALSSGACLSETLSEPVCEPASMEASEGGAEDGGAPGDASSSKTGGDATTDATTAGSEGGILAGSFVGIMAGEYHGCAWDQAGDVSCWGENEYGEYGSGNSPGSTTPTPAATGVTVTAMAGGNDNTCAVTTAGSVECWGYGQYGDLGNGATADSLTPVAVTGLSSGAVSVAMGYDVGCALTTAGAVSCWGNGVLGNGTNTQSSTPVQVTGLTSGVAKIAAGLGHVCAVTEAGALVCWGNDDGDPDGGSAAVPEPVSGMSSGAAAVALGEAHSCALTTAGAVSCWGSNQYGQLGNGAPLDGDASPASSPVPVAVSDLPSNIASIGAGYNHSCAVTTGGAALCWGDNANGQLGNGTTTNSSVPVPVSGLSSGVARIVGGNNYTCALTTLGGVLCWGSNEIAQFEGGFDYGSVPVDVFNP